MQLLLVKKQERLVSLIRVLPLGSVEVNSNSYWSDQAGFNPGANTGLASSHVTSRS